uniref:hypothetical protein n=1 Tax=Novosphingobium sp. TaxID=1874826 RepID=UPI0026359DF9
MTFEPGKILSAADLNAALANYVPIASLAATASGQGGTLVGLSNGDNLQQFIVKLLSSNGAAIIGAASGGSIQAFINTLLSSAGAAAIGYGTVTVKAALDSALQAAAQATGTIGMLTTAVSAGGALPFEVTALSGSFVGTGSGGTPGEYALVVSGGPAGHTAFITIGSDGKVASGRIGTRGIATSNTAPIYSLPSGTGLTGATLPTATVTALAAGRIFFAPSSDGTRKLAWQSSGGVIAAYNVGGVQWSELFSGGLDSIFTQIVGGPRIVATDESGNELIEITANRIDHPDMNAIRAQAATSATAGQAMVATPGGARLTVTDESGNELLEVTQSRIDHPDMNAVRPLALASATAGQSMAGLPGGARVAITDEAGNVMAEVTSTRINHPDTNAMRAAIATPSAGTLRRLRALAAAAAVSNPWDNPVMASPPTMTADATVDSSLTRQFRPASGGVLVNNDFGLFGGVPVVTGGLPTMTYLSAVTRGTGTTASGGNINGSGKTQYGQRIRFQHFGTKFDFLTYGTAKWRLIVNGQYASRSFLTSSAGSTANPSYNHVVFSSIGIRNIEIELDGGTPFGGVNCEPTGYIEQPGFDDALRMI